MIQNNLSKRQHSDRFHVFRSHLEPLRLVELDGGLILNKDLVQIATFNFPLLVEHFFVAVDAADNVDVPAVLQTLRAQALQVIELEQRAVVGGCVCVRPLEVEGLLLPVVPEEDLRLHGLDEAPKQAGCTVETQRGRSVRVLPLLIRRELLIFTSLPL